MLTETEALKARINELERENQYLRRIIENAGINYSSALVSDESTQNIFDPNQGVRILPVEITRNHAR